MRVSGGLKEEGIYVGNAFNKYGSENPIVRKIMNGFEDSLSDLLQSASPKTIHEIGCGEGYWVNQWNQQNYHARGSDFSSQAIAIAQENAKDSNITSEFFQKSIYNLDRRQDSADLIVCCEVLEHLEDPFLGMRALQRITQKHIILSVPREPIWCFLNLARGKYIHRFGNTPGHIQHWSRKGFLRLVSNYFTIVKENHPFPWSMVLCKPRYL